MKPSKTKRTYTIQVQLTKYQRSQLSTVLQHAEAYMDLHNITKGQSTIEALKQATIKPLRLMEISIDPETTGLRYLEMDDMKRFFINKK